MSSFNWGSVGESGCDRTASPRAYNEAFVDQCYLRYLRRPPDAEGLEFWAGKLNRRVPRVGDGDYSEMIRAFIVSGEYRGRFGQ